MPTKYLPPNPSIKQLKIQAKDFLKSHKTGDVAVCEILRLLHRFSNSTENEILEADVSLKDVQFALALSYGFKGWEQLAEYVKSVIQAPVEEKNTAASEECDERYDEAITGFAELEEFCRQVGDKVGEQGYKELREECERRKEKRDAEKA